MLTVYTILSYRTLLIVVQRTIVIYQYPMSSYVLCKAIKLCATNHQLKWGPFPPNEVGRIAQHVRKGEGRAIRCPCTLLTKGRGRPTNLVSVLQSNVLLYVAPAPKVLNECGG